VRLFGGRQKPKNDLVLFFATDIHGSRLCFRKFLSSLAFYSADVAILGGDMTGKMIVPIVHQGQGRYLAHVSGQETTLPEAEVPELEGRLADAGYYPHKMERDEYLDLEAHPERVDDLFAKAMLATLRDWNDLAEKKYAGTDTKIYVAPGNDDPWFIDAEIAQLPRFELLENRVVTLAGRYEMLATGYATPTPWNTHREVSEEELGKRIDELAKQLHSVPSAIFNLHDPPYNTGIDEGPDLDPVTLRSRGGMGQAATLPVGSKAVKAAIEEYQPMLALHGHIHESRGAVRIGRTLCINPGSEYGDRVLRGCLVQLADGEVSSFQLTSG
jgi:Icc-related predicted phosphoesterase